MIMTILYILIGIALITNVLISYYIYKIKKDFTTFNLIKLPTTEEIVSLDNEIKSLKNSYIILKSDFIAECETLRNSTDGLERLIVIEDSLYLKINKG